MEGKCATQNGKNPWPLLTASLDKMPSQRTTSRLRRPMSLQTLASSSTSSTLNLENSTVTFQLMHRSSKPCRNTPHVGLYSASYIKWILFKMTTAKAFSMNVQKRLGAGQKGSRNRSYASRQVSGTNLFTRHGEASYIA